MPNEDIDNEDFQWLCQVCGERFDPWDFEAHTCRTTVLHTLTFSQEMLQPVPVPLSEPNAIVGGYVLYNDDTGMRIEDVVTLKETELKFFGVHLSKKQLTRYRQYWYDHYLHCKVSSEFGLDQ